MSLPDLLAVLNVVVAVPVVSIVTWQMGRLSDSQPESWVLRWTAVSSLAIQFIVSVFSAVYVNNSMPHPFISGFWTSVITRSATLALVIPPLYWLWLRRR